MGVTIGNNCRIYGNSPNMWGTEPFLIKIGNNVHITNGCKFNTHDGGTLILRKETPDLELTSPITVGNDVYFGLDTLIMQGVTIGDRVIVGARSVITKSIEGDSLIVGTPACKIKTVDQYHEEIKLQSLKIGHLDRDSKEIELKKIFRDR
ncbi:acyltransferase [Chryseobacterium sp. MDT2-18]|uniref:acyltransferase n=1 Tax=Chryseobacterium sp. MDT2-18 TaxID=1259136 RepID=UPI00277DB371|nr:acyltransferase [Chryseobacterium sp. MDT2-18]MDQ0476443.1 acetyltransferase-like isoleucine patch superfamily enzyme [Chryseobacterium sp. MDT2-18]